MPARPSVRLFVAIDAGSAEAAGDRPRAPEHLTLHFLGEVLPERVPAIEERLAEIARETPGFDLELDGIGAFPNSRNPRVVWVGVKGGRAEVSALAHRIGSALGAGPAEAATATFVPHLTLFRVRSPAQRRRAAALLSGAEPPPPPRTVPIRELHLKESTLSPGGAHHRTLASWPLAGPATESK